MLQIVDPTIVFQRKDGARSDSPKFGFRKYILNPDGKLTPWNHHARRKQIKRIGSR